MLAWRHYGNNVDILKISNVSYIMRVFSVIGLIYRGLFSLDSTRVSEIYTEKVKNSHPEVLYKELFSKLSEKAE